MDITSILQAGQLSPMRPAKFTAPADQEQTTPGCSLDRMDISQGGRQAADLNLNGITAEAFMEQVHQQLGEQKLEVNWNAAVDPDGQIWCKAYFDSYVSQATQFRDAAESAIKSHYAGAYQEALNSPLGRDLTGQLNFLAAKYQCSWSDYFDASIPAGERQWTYTQVRAMLTNTGLRLNDPYALKDIHVPTAEETSKTARQAADDKISALVQQAKAAEK
ncbi:MAG: hypothetical protein HFF57_06490 [Lawsonibacter sp.]|nr:hypothetical protein [Lawsonibacter sp.]